MKTLLLNIKLLNSLSNVLGVSPAELRNATGISNGTWYRIMSKPDGVTVQQLLSIANGLHIPVSRFFTDGEVIVVGRREDYVTEPYLECYYDEAKLHSLVSHRPEATWKAAAKHLGMSRQYARDSLMAVTRTPITRFLGICHVFGIYPFDILIDPNQTSGGQTAGHRVAFGGSPAELSATLSKMQKKMQLLSDAVDNLTAKYETLLQDNRALHRRLDELTGEAKMAAEEP